MNELFCLLACWFLKTGEDWASHNWRNVKFRAKKKGWFAGKEYYGESLQVVLL